MKTKKKAPSAAKRAQRVCPTCGQLVLKHKREDTAELTPRQIESLRRIAAGMTAQEIADELGLSRRTVEFHRMMLMERLGLHTTAELTLWASKNGYA
jgi:DNA-binding CsgD family transcriptional regulator